MYRNQSVLLLDGDRNPGHLEIGKKCPEVKKTLRSFVAKQSQIVFP